MINALEKDFLAAASFKGSWEAYFETEQKDLLYTLVWMSLLCVSRKEKTKKILFIGSKFSFPYVDI